MKTLAIAIFTLLYCFPGSSQVDTALSRILGGEYVIASVNRLTSTTYEVMGAFSNPDPYWPSDSVAAGDYIVDGNCRPYQIYQVLSNGSGVVHARVSGSTVEPALSTGALARVQGTAGLYAIVNHLPSTPYSCLLEDLIYKLGTEYPTFADVDSLTQVSFDSDRPILRVPTVGTVIGQADLIGWAEWWYFSAPTLSLALSPTTTIYEVGDTARITVSGATSNPGSATLSNGGLDRTYPSTLEVDGFGSGTSYAFIFSFYPQKDSTSHYKQTSYSFQASQDWVSGSESGTATSTTRTVTAVYPILYGMSATDFSVGGDPYTGLTKLVQAEGNKTVSLTGSGFIYYAVPKTWGDYTLSSIIDHNGFNVTPSFTAYDITVSSSGLVNDWTSVAYKMYKLNTTTTTAGYAYQFNR